MLGLGTEGTEHLLVSLEADRPTEVLEGETGDDKEDFLESLKGSTFFTESSSGGGLRLFASSVARRA